MNMARLDRQGYGDVQVAVDVAVDAAELKSA